MQGHMGKVHKGLVRRQKGARETASLSFIGVSAGRAGQGSVNSLRCLLSVVEASGYKVVFSSLVLGPE